MSKTCDICNHICENKVYSSIGGQKVCSIKCASSVTPNFKDECGNFGSVVWEDENYNVNGVLCCSRACREALRSKNNKNSSSKKNDYYNPSSKKSSKNNQNYNYYEPQKNKFEASPGMKVGGTNVAFGPRDWDTNDYDMGPGDENGNYYHGDPMFAKYSLGDDDDSEAYGDVNERNYINEYGSHKIIKKNEHIAMDQIKQLGGSVRDNKPKNEAHSVVHHGYDIHCDYCDFIIKDGTNCFVDNFGKKFHTEECFSNYFQGIPKPNFG